MSSGAYELLLRFDGGREELRLTDHLPRFAREEGLLLIRDLTWRVTAETRPSSPAFAARLLCVAEGASSERPAGPTR